MSLALFTDTETSGLNPTVDKVIGVGACLIEIDNENETFTFKSSLELYNDIKVRIPYQATKVHGIDNKLLEKLSGGKTIYEMATEISCFQNADIIGGFNVSFDVNMIKGTYGINLKSIPQIDAYRYYQKKHGKTVRLENMAEEMRKLGYNVEDWVKDFDIDVPNRLMSGYHSCIYDAYISARAQCELQGYLWS